MKKLRYLIGVIGIMVLFSTPLSAESILFTDITGHWAENDIYFIADQGLLNGYGDGTFLPNNQITRAEFATILAKDAKVDLTQFDYKSTFTDVGNHWAKAAINWASSVGVTTGYTNKTFKPQTKINREELAVMLSRHINAKTQLPVISPKDTFNDDASISKWAKDAVYNMQTTGLINGKENHKFEPQSKASRGETATMVARYLHATNVGSSSSATAALYVNNNLAKSNLVVESKDSVAMVATRTFLEALNCKVDFYNNTSLITAYNHEKDIEMWLGKNTAYANGNQRNLATAPYISQGNSMIPMVDVGVALGISVTQRNWGTDSQSIMVTMNTTAVNLNNQSFYGSVTNSSPNGQVNMESTPNFLGTVTNGEMSYGSYTSDNQHRYFGSWSQGKMHGSGRSINSLGELSVGTFSDGHFANGITYFADGTTFNGEWSYNTSTTAVYPSKGVLTDGNRSYGTSSTDWSGGALAQSKW